MDSQLKRGLIEAAVLAAVQRRESYGYEIIRELPESLGMTESTLYPVLRRLSKAGMLVQRTAEHNGRLRRYFHITEDGVQRIEEFLGSWSQVNEVYDFVRGGADTGAGAESGAGIGSDSGSGDETGVATATVSEAKELAQ